jgi:benzoyl-CoA reductase/2-hydroxyglutaryl-CoA dehydratase subunit BcrC/BadD/HgdB
VESFLVRERLTSGEKRKGKRSVPYIPVETDYSQSDTEQLSTRMGAFMEMIA